MLLAALIVTVIVTSFGLNYLLINRLLLTLK
jgi:hypothetical protein